MANIQNICLEKKDIQRSSDGLRLSPSQWDDTVMCENKSQGARAAQIEEWCNNKYRETSRKLTRGSYDLESVNNQANVRDAAVSSGFNDTIECVLPGKPLNGDVSQKHNIRGLCNSGHIASAGVNKVNIETIEIPEHAQGCHEVKILFEKSSASAVPRDTNLRSGCSRVYEAKNYADFQANHDENEQSAHETRITSLRKLLKSPIHFGTSKNSTVSIDDGAEELLSINLPTDCGSNIDGADCTSLTQATCPEYVLKEEFPEESSMGSKLTNRKRIRKRSSKTVDNSLNTAGHDEVKEKIAELARTPRIKSLQEIIESLRIKLDTKLFEKNGSANSAHRSRKNDFPEAITLGERSSFNGIHSSHKNINHTSNFMHSRIPSNGCRKEIFTKQPLSNTEELSSDSSKSVKILISGEVSRKQSCTSQNTHVSANSFSDRLCSDLYGENGHWKLIDESDRGRDKNVDMEQKRMNEKFLKKKQKVLASKRQVSNTKELRAILQARTSYRKDIFSGLQSESESSVLEIPCKKPRGDVEIPSSILQTEKLESYCNCQNSSSERSECFRLCCYGGFNNEKITDSTANSPIKEFDNTVLLEKPLSAVESNIEQSDADVFIKTEVDSILSQLPPLDKTDITWSESQDSEHKVAHSQETESLVSKEDVKKIEGYTGNYSYETPKITFREWHETVVRPSYCGDSFILLPYVVID